ncbi:MAG: hypothetical protein KI790_11305 [Cyclobacteriaceae bacterium]|nr:hypothetical protein [Cyclobacteriaceae bacterium HetDA_MAG_MS6]
MKKLLIIILVLAAAAVQGQKKKDIEAIKSMCGCYKVTFEFAETFAPKQDYEFHNNYRSGALEYVLPIEETKNKIVLQHLLVIGDSMIIKHWRQDWVYENTDFYTFHKENTWKYVEIPKSEVKGQWTQKVYQVDDGPRYEGSASWVHLDDRHFWESTADAPLPRREFSKRDDYNVMKRRNRQEITAYGWLHEQDNDKIIRESSDELLAREKGWNTYEKVEESKCNLAKTWWEENSRYWADVRSVWDEYFQSKKDLSINMKVDGKILFQRVFALGDRVNPDQYDSEAAKKEIREIFNLHFKQGSKLAFAK